MASWPVIVEFIKPLEPFVNDPEVTEICVNAGGANVAVERSGNLEIVDGLMLDPHSLIVGIKAIGRACGIELPKGVALLEAKLEDGSRVSAALPPVASDGANLTIRKFTHRYSLDTLVHKGTLSDAQASDLRASIARRDNIIVSGGTATGKTTLLNALAQEIPRNQRVIMIEETSEIKFEHPMVVRWEAREGQPDAKAITPRMLVKAALRHRPDRIILGEIRDEAAFDLLQAMNSGHPGSLSTVHANNPAMAMSKLAQCVLMAGTGLPHDIIVTELAAAIDLVVHIERAADGHRRVSSMLRLRNEEARCAAQP